MDIQTVCVKCRAQLATKDWTCPHCGAIADRYLFGTIKLKSLEGESRNAYQRGYRECKDQGRTTASTTIRPDSYHPTPGFETAYRAGWQRAADELDAKADRKFGRRRGLRVMGSGVLLLLFGLGIGFGTNQATGGRVTVLTVAPIGMGVVSIVIGFVMILTGETDDARPDA